ncbi:hypothetical protein AWB70_00668 [Caballeronia cordobensis]|uniref:Uncharacterized protein n=1 Tax=Caballeronia cordobensis TaxID=1353886 RepID=A0A158F7L2_CABCO|nr:hypothetical protein [Caballeronia cordobensis]SAL15757.1 hypothetical protein AWB70_00668 [Caballeronia cordobensis]
MNEVIDIAAWRCLATIGVRYEGNDAASHEIDLNQLGQSIQGLARIFALCSNALLTGELNTHLEALDVRVVCSPVMEHRCFEVLAMVKSMATSKELWSGAFGAVLAVVIQYVLSRREQDQMKYVNEILSRRDQEMSRRDEEFARRDQNQTQYASESLQHVHDALQMALRNNQANTESVVGMADKLVSLIDKLTEILRSAATQALSPIDRSCSQIDLYVEGDRFMTLDKDHKRAFSRAAVVPSESRQYVGVISEFDMTTGACKVTLDGDTERVPAIVIDPSFNRPDNRYVQAMLFGDALRFFARADLDLEGRPVRLYISDPAEDKAELADA